MAIVVYCKQPKTPDWVEFPPLAPGVDGEISGNRGNLAKDREVKT